MYVYTHKLAFFVIQKVQAVENRVFYNRQSASKRKMVSLNEDAFSYRIVGLKIMKKM